jgi:hypothetical protein|tara:strand:+ start:54 stop:572 length:519 start_codon:yes stop_codon:yes gene_type:complete
MTLEAITTFIRIFDGNNNEIHRFQNSNTSSEVTYTPDPIKDPVSCFTGTRDSLSYPYLPFIYNGATKSIAGDNIESNLTFEATELTLANAYEAVDNFYGIEVYTVLMAPDTFVQNRLLTTECWVITGMNYNVEGVQLRLSTSIDAVTSSVPNQVLRSDVVGALPVSSRINNA